MRHTQALHRGNTANATFFLPLLHVRINLEMEPLTSSMSSDEAAGQFIPWNLPPLMAAWKISRPWLRGTRMNSRINQDHARGQGRGEPGRSPGHENRSPPPASGGGLKGLAHDALPEAFGLLDRLPSSRAFPNNLRERFAVPLADPGPAVRRSSGGLFPFQPEPVLRLKVGCPVA